MKQRVAAFDIMKGIAILLVIVGHCNLVPAPPGVIKWIYSFHMPLFFLLAGYFHKTTDDYGSLLKKTSVRLLAPYLFTSAILLLYALLSALHNANVAIALDTVKAVFFASGSLHHSRFFANGYNIGPVWFLVALFWCKNVVNYCLSKGCRDWVVFLLALVATLMDYYVINLPFALLPGLSSMCFFLVGYRCATTRFISAESKWRWLVWLCVACWPFAVEYGRAFMAVCTYKWFPLAFLGACGGTLVIYWVSTAIERYTSYVSDFLSWSGRNSLAILCIHNIIMNVHIVSHIPFVYRSWGILLVTELSLALCITWLCSKIHFTSKIFGMS